MCWVLFFASLFFLRRRVPSRSGGGGDMIKGSGWRGNDNDKELYAMR